MRATARLAIFVLFLTGCARSTGTLVTTPVTREDANAVVTASGTVNAQDTVIVGSQVSGTIQAILVDYNSRVHRGQVLARIDPSTFEAALLQAQSAYAQTQAQQATAQSTAAAAMMDERSAQAAIRQARSAYALARKNAERDEELLAKGFAAQSVVDSDHNAVTFTLSAYQSAVSAEAAARNRADAAAATARAASRLVEANRAAAQQAQLNLDHTTITSPVDGTVIQRNVSIGQTVAAAFQSPTLFTIARDLGKMEVDIAVGEPDVGSVHAGQPVSFTVLAYPGMTFHGNVYQVRENPTIVSNVTTYNTVVYEDNRDGRLRPGMNATASIVIARFAGALVVPLAALQFRPTAAIAQRYHLPSRSPSPKQTAARAGSQWGQTGTAAASAVVARARGRVFALRDGKLQAVALTILAVNGTTVAVKPAAGAHLSAGDAVATEIAK
ncbi:MAG TPA: efflux RND transporter periplasmic adaptor subunit [Candidatus Aquilonibacter sp.]|nr:efflux RND transporter periplasmic adaptor subunit [Candidatus Aquilonibacter sp.]